MARFFFLAVALLAFSGRPAFAADALVVVAANFAEVMQDLERAFEGLQAHRITVTGGSTGQLYAQIQNGAPFDVFLAADQARPSRLEAAGLAVAGSRHTYALGRLVLWSRDPGRLAGDAQEVLAGGDFRALAMANHALAPYGAAARQTLAALGLAEKLAPRLVVAENVGQAFAMVATGSAELGFVSGSYVASPRNGYSGSRWDVPAELYDPIRQDAVVLARAADNPAARGFMDFLRSRTAKDIIARYGYGIE